MMKFVEYDGMTIIYELDNYRAYKPAEDTFLMLKYIDKYAKGKVLDLGCGTGILGIYAYKYADSVTFSDILEDSIIISKVNFYINYVDRSFDPRYYRRILRYDFTKHRVSFTISNLFENIDGRYDLILFNPPYLPKIDEEDLIIQKWISGGNYGYETIVNFLENAKYYLNKDGLILLIFSSLSNDDLILDKARQLGYSFDLLDSSEFFYERLYLYSFWI